MVIKINCWQQYKIRYLHFPNFSGETKAEFLIWAWFICFENLTSVIEYDKKWYPSMHSMLHTLCYPTIWWNSVQFWLFVRILSLRPKFGILFLIIFFSCWLPVFTGVLTKYSGENYLPYHFQTKYIWFIMIGDQRCFSCRNSILDFVSDTAFCLFVNFDLCFLRFLIG